jgi:Flp pilus assembly protein TadG
MHDRLHAATTAGFALFGRFRRDQSGNYLIITAALLPALVNLVGLGTDYGVWIYAQQAMQSAADSAAVSAAWGYLNGSSDTSIVTQAHAITSSYTPPFVNGANNVTVTVNRPPQSGSYASQTNAVEVIISQPQTPLFSALFLPNQVTVTSRAVALANKPADGCVLSLDSTASGATTVAGTATVTLTNCSLYSNSNNTSSVTVNGGGKISAKKVGAVGGIPSRTAITTTDGIAQNTGAPMADPYANVAVPSLTGPINTTCGNNGNCPSGTLQPGIYANGMKLTGSTSVTLNSGTYFIEGSGLDVAANATLQGTGVTLVFTSGNGSYPTTMATINGGATVNLTAPTTGSTAGIVIFGDRTMPVGTTFKFNAGGSTQFTGAVYAPKGAVQYASGASNPNSCTQLIADTISFGGAAYFAINCSGTGIQPLGASAVGLVE